MIDTKFLLAALFDVAMLLLRLLAVGIPKLANFHFATYIESLTYFSLDFAQNRDFEWISRTTPYTINSPNMAIDIFQNQTKGPCSIIFAFPFNYPRNKEFEYSERENTRDYFDSYTTTSGALNQMRDNDNKQVQAAV